jgi:aspartyl-tRNA(Asn)/glutamyl-tRNA(Gln) amidotransferase subunit A
MGALRSLSAAREMLSLGEDAYLELASLALHRAHELEGGEAPIHAFLSLVEEPPRFRAELSPAGGAAASRLAGVPIAVKDNICTLGLPTTCGSRLLEGYVSPYAATAVRRLEESGAWVIGKTNLDEFGMGSSTENSAFGPTRNPADRKRVPGGSSGGSAAAVAAGVVPAALGSSTGGSIRQPAAMCGVVGVKPTYGRVSRYGLVAFASSLDHVGVFARSVPDAAAILGVVVGVDRRDATSRPRDPGPVSTSTAGEPSEALRGRSIGVPAEYFGDELDDGVRQVAERALDTIGEAGARLIPVSLPSTATALSCYYVVAPAEASANLARFDGVRYGRRATGGRTLSETYLRSRGEGFGDEVKRRILLGTHVLSARQYEAYYLRALELRRHVHEDFRRAFRTVDALFAPTTPTVAFRLGEKRATPTEMYTADIFTVAANLAGIPAMTIPIGNQGGMPVGGQLMCAAWEEEKMLGIAAALETCLEYVHPLAGEA